MDDLSDMKVESSESSLAKYYYKSTSCVDSQSNEIENRSALRNLEQVRSEGFLDEYWSYTKVLPHTHEILMHVKTKIFEQFKDAKEVMLQIDGRSWPVKLSFDSRGGCSFSSGSGWSVFSQENSLHGGDECKFERVNMKDPVLKVSVSRK
ncbi:hypothetical protein ACFE04_009639 [Oxalis oulophora]